MGVSVIDLDWWNEKVCRNFLFGTCPHLIFGNTVSWTELNRTGSGRLIPVSRRFPLPHTRSFLYLRSLGYFDRFLRPAARKWTSAHVPKPTPTGF